MANDQVATGGDPRGEIATKLDTKDGTRRLSLPQVHSAMKHIANAAHPCDQQLNRFTDLCLGRYQIQKLLGCLGPATILLAWDPVLGRPVILKVFHRGPNSHNELLLLKEARALAKLRHPGIAACYGIEETPAAVILCIEYVPGRTLHEVLGGTQLPYSRAIRILRQLTENLVVVHEAGLVHRDLKPSNVMVPDDGSIKLIDFGLADGPGSPANSDSSGTPAYMAPEVARGESESFDARTDIFGLGAIFYEMLTGQPPFLARGGLSAREVAATGVFAPPESLRPGLPRFLRDICERCLAPRKEDRFATARDLLVELCCYEQRQQWRRRLVLVTASVVLAIGICGGLVWGAQRMYRHSIHRAVAAFTQGEKRLKEYTRSGISAIAQGRWKDAESAFRNACQIADSRHLRMAYGGECQHRLQECITLGNLPPVERRSVERAIGQLLDCFDELTTKPAPDQKRVVELVKLLEPSADIIKQALGDDSYFYLRFHDIQRIVHGFGDPKEMSRHAMAARVGYEQLLGPLSMLTLEALRREAGALRGIGCHELADGYLARASAAAMQLPVAARSIAIDYLEIDAMSLTAGTNATLGQSKFEEAHRLRQLLYGPNAPIPPKSHFRRATYHKHRREMNQMSHHAEALYNDLKSLPEDDPQRHLLPDACALWALGLSHEGTFKDKAALLENEADAVSQRCNGGESLSHAMLLRDLTQSCMARADNQAAFAYSEDAYQIVASIFDEPNSHTVGFATNAAVTAWGANQPQEARRYLAVAIEQFQSLSDAHRSRYMVASSGANFAYLSKELGDRKPAIHWASQTLSYCKRELGQLEPASQDREMLQSIMSRCESVLEELRLDQASWTGWASGRICGRLSARWTVVETAA